MAPEILFMRDSGGYTAKADLWSVGCIAFELLHGRAPYGSAPRSTEADLRRDIADDRRFVRDPPPALSEACRELVGRLLQRRPEARLGYEEFFEHRWLARRGSGSSGGGGGGGSTGGGGGGGGGGGAQAGQQRIIAKKYVLVPGSPIGEGSFAAVSEPPRPRARACLPRPARGRAGGAPRSLRVGCFSVRMAERGGGGGAGGGGQVFKGRHQDTDEPVAIKEISLSKIRRRSPELAARHQQNLRNETECLRSLNHPNIVRLLGEAASSRLRRPCARARGQYARRGGGASVRRRSLFLLLGALFLLSCGAGTAAMRRLARVAAPRGGSGRS